MVRRMRFELMVHRLKAYCHTTWLTTHLLNCFRLRLHFRFIRRQLLCSKFYLILLGFTYYGLTKNYALYQLSYISCTEDGWTRTNNHGFNIPN